MAGQFDNYVNNTGYWLITPFSSYYALAAGNIGSATNVGVWSSNGIKPAFNLKENVIITSGEGTLQNPFQIELAN